MSKQTCVKFLKDIVEGLGIDQRPTIKDEVEYLTQKLTGSEIASVAKLVDAVVRHTHSTHHLPWLQGLHAVRQHMQQIEKDKP
jgi:predicted metallo-beta-lactamase superfamily hydrolase